MKTWLKVFIGFSVAVLIGLIAVSGYLAWTLLDGNPNKKRVESFFENEGYEKPVLDEKPVVEVPKVVRDPEELSEEEEKQEEEVVKRINVLALGVDARSNHLGGRSDAIMVVSIDKTNSRLDLVSIPRDSYVEIGDTGRYDKINHAYAFGGVKESIRTVENLFSIDIDYYLVFNFSSFVELIDVIGGIEIDVPYSFSEQDSKDRQGAVKLEKGLQTLNGEQALAYARMRKSDPKGDIGRGQRQQEVVLAILKKLLDTSSLTNILDIHKTLKKSTATDVSVTDLPDLYGYLTTYENIVRHNLEGRSTSINGVYYYQLDKDSVEAIIKELNR